ncbi:MAG: MoxR family ATPase [Gemmataceae bacterium]|nr:MoxR family ATPase [Gemmataceae bacterium]
MAKQEPLDPSRDKKKPQLPAVDVQALSEKVISNIEKVILGKRKQISLALASYLAEGHILLEDVPGVAKTILARAIARSIGCVFKRVQCTPDLLPSDISGVSIFNLKTSEFEFRPGPIFAQTVLADEINRATPRTQAALLEAMAERRVTCDGQTYTLKPPFLVIATQNPVDHEGTFPLPEAQLDRFLVKLSLGYPSQEEELQMLQRLQYSHPIDEVAPVVSAGDWVACQEAVRQIHLDNQVRNYILEIVHATRANENILLGGSPRASLALQRASQALAAMEGRGFVIPDDIKRLVNSVLNHRIILKPETRLRKVKVEDILKELVDDIPVPVSSDYYANQGHF